MNFSMNKNIRGGQHVCSLSKIAVSSIVSEGAGRVGSIIGPIDPRILAVGTRVTLLATINDLGVTIPGALE